MTPRVSVCMTVYNGAEFLRPAIDSLLAQDFNDYEVVIVDNGSTDATADILADYQHPRLRKLSCPHQTYIEVKRFISSQVTGELIAVLDADDTASPDRLSRQVALFDVNPKLGLVGSWVNLINSEGKTFGALRPPASHEDLINCLPHMNPIAHSSFMFRREVAEAVGGYRPDLSYAPDFGLELDLMRAGYQLAVIPAPLIGLRQHDNQATYSAVFANVRSAESYRLYREARSLPGLSRQALSLGRKTLALSALHQSWALLKLGKPFGSLIWLVQASRWQPAFSAHYFAQQCWGCLRRWMGLN